VVIVNDYARVNGGAARVAVSSAVALAGQGLQVHFFASIGPPDPALEEAGVSVTLLNGEPYNRSAARFKAATAGLWDRETAGAFRELLSKLDPKHTVVHAHTFRDALSASVPAMAIELGFPTVYTAHEYTVGCPYGGFYDYRHVHACQLRGLSARCIATACNEGSYVKKLWYVANQAIYQKVAALPRRFNRVFFVSERSQEILSSYLGTAVRQQVLRNPIRIAQEPPAEIVADSPFIFVGALNSFKDPVTLASAAKEANVPVAFVGDGPLQKAIAAMNPEAELAGWLSEEEVTKRLRGARAVVMSSLGFETFGMSVAEGAACGIGSIVTDVCVASDWVKKTGSGLTYEAKNVQALAAGLRELADLDRARELGRIAYDTYWSDPPTIEKHVSELVAAYEEELAVRAQ
jgi:glycosyltransferase involved in cell wall biosynthesis